MLCTERATGKPKYFYFDRQLQYHPEFFYLKPTEEEMQLDDAIKSKIPQNIDVMFDYAEKLAKPFPFVRVDFYHADNKVIFGELTFLSSGGFDNEGYAMRNSDIDIGKPVVENSNV